MGKFRAVKIIHSIYDRIDYLFLAEFFRFCGLYVGEDTTSQFDPVKELEKRCFDFFICVSDTESLDVGQKSGMEQLDREIGFLAFKEIRSETLKGDRNKRIRELDNKKKEALLKACMKQVDARRGTDEISLMNELFHIYIKYDLTTCSMSLQYYPKKDSFAVQEAGNGMLGAYQNLQRKKGDIPDINGYAEYARIWCAVKVNTVCEWQKKILYFPPQELAEECVKLNREYPDFSNVKVLEGLCYEHSKDMTMEAIRAFERALDSEKENCYANAIYYWLGKRYEAYSERRETARKYYQAAYDTRRKFRNVYKLAIYERDCGRYLKSEAYFNEIIDALKDRKTGEECNLLDPLELEYKFKAYQQMCVMFYNQCDDVTIKYRKAIQYGKAAINVREHEIDQSLIYTELYGTDTEMTQKYRNISKGKMNLENINKILFMSYSDLQDYELARKYRDSMKNDG